jgi:hypothetical protein
VRASLGIFGENSPGGEFVGDRKRKGVREAQIIPTRGALTGWRGAPLVDEGFRWRNRLGGLIGLVPDLSDTCVQGLKVLVTGSPGLL